jgi:hypothetical protein
MDDHSKLLEFSSRKVDGAFNGAVKPAGAKSPSEFYGMARPSFRHCRLAGD